MCCSRKYPYPSHRRFFSLNPPTPHPSRNSILVSYFPSKNRAFETPLPLGISVNLPWGGHGYFLELHIAYLYHVMKTQPDYKKVGKAFYFEWYYTNLFHHAPVHCIFWYTVEYLTCHYFLEHLTANSN